jgi:hypothetical protein
MVNANLSSGVMIFLKIKRASVCCCRLIKSTRIGFDYCTAFSIFSSISVPTKLQPYSAFPIIG